MFVVRGLREQSQKIEGEMDQFVLGYNDLNVEKGNKCWGQQLEILTSFEQVSR